MNKTSDQVRRWLGQSYFIGFSGLAVPESVRQFIRNNHIGGVTLFANNYESPAQVADLVDELQSLRGSNPPLVIAVDHEGGKVQRFRKPFSHFPEARTIAEKKSPKLAFECAAVMGRELAAVGINVVFAPVADINTNPNNPIIGRRAYGETQEEVTRMVTATVRGFLSQGVQCVVKHFPGHGDTTEDSHLHLPRVSTSAEVMIERELKPFTKAFKAGCEMLMTAHIISDGFDAELPATLSPKILQKVLREQLGYEGIIFSDDMEMKAIADHYGEIDAPMMALEAGVDIFLYHTEPFEMRVFEPLLEKLMQPSGAKALVALEIAAHRVEQFKRNHFMPIRPIDRSTIAQVIGAPEHLALVQSF